MTKIITAGFLGLVSCAALGIMKENQGFRAPRGEAKEAVEGFLWLEAESFADYGEWRLDTQFVHKMGSAYLLAAGVLKPIKSATTVVRFPVAGKWRAWVRTKDWLSEYHPGKFRLSVAGQPGNTLGASGKDGWRWELAGEWELPAGEAKVSLDDLSGAFARCDALLFTQDSAYVPPDDADECAAARRRFTGADAELVADAGRYDLVVVGAGPGGISTAIAAARHGLRVALVHDRPVLGGNSSSEIGVPTEGASNHHAKDCGREGGICEEANLRRLVAPDFSLSHAYREMVDALPNLSVFDNQRVVAVGMDGARIASVEARSTLDGTRRRWAGRLFVDCTGDGWVGVFAGAKRMYGREAASEYGEAPAPEVRDDLTMSGSLACGTAEIVRYGHMYIGYMQRRAGDTPVPYETPAWAQVLPPDFNRKVWHPNGEWWLEHGGRFDDLDDPERARDELVRIDFAYWGWLKNKWAKKDSIKCNELVEISHTNGRREGWRLVGDYVLTANDCLQGRMFDDRVAYGGWPLDTHDPLGIDNPTGNGWWMPHPGVPVYSIPFRCLYSVNVPNLMMAGRNISVTHIALGSTRVMATIMTIGQAVGTAAAEMLDAGLLPREYGADPVRIRRLQQLLLKDDQYIPGIANADPDDLARTAKVTATSTRKDGVPKPVRVIDGFSRNVKGVAHCWASEPDQGFPQTLTLEFAKPVSAREVRLTFDPGLNMRHTQGEPLPRTLVKAYAVEAFDGKDWTPLVSESNNILRHRIHKFQSRMVTALRIRIDETWGEPSARVFEVRVY